MNTLGYVARQFDVLASPRTPPSTPTTENNALPRVRTWSTQSFLFPPRPQRSHSSPSLAPAPQPEHHIEPPRSKQHIESVIDQIFFIRVFLLVWDHLKCAWSSLSISSKVKGKAKESDPPPPLLLSPLGSTPPTSPSPSPPTITSRSATPILTGTKKTPFHLPKTLVLDLDETLIHSTSRPIPYTGSSSSNLLGLGSWGKNKGAGHTVEVVLGGRSTLYHVYKRPFVDFFLRTVSIFCLRKLPRVLCVILTSSTQVSGWYTLVIFTASMQEYADPVIDWLDAGRGILPHRFFRDVRHHFHFKNNIHPLIDQQSCTQLPNGSYTKDLSVVEADLARVCLVDNSPVSYTVNEGSCHSIRAFIYADGNP